jgi:AraC-like DNA-binding protein
MSAKRFIERFKAQVGVSLKRYCRIRRFQHALARAHRGQPVDRPQVALECGYYDQAHFIHEFRAFSGLTPWPKSRTPAVPSLPIWSCPPRISNHESNLFEADLNINQHNGFGVSGRHSWRESPALGA